MITNANTHIFGKDNTPESNLLTLTIMSPGTTKLALIKIIKEITSLGLMESKDIVDNSLGSIQIIKFHYQDSGINSLRNSLDNCADLKYTLTSLNQIRNRKLIELGIFNKDDLISEIIESDVYHIFQSRCNLEEIKKLLSDRYNLLNTEDLKTILNL